MFFFAALGILATGYAGLFLFCARRWKHIPERTNGKALDEGISIVIPFRNEKKRLPNLLDWLKMQEFDGPVEVILADDHSEDGSAQLCLDFISAAHLANWRVLEAEGAGKKAALGTGIRSARYPWILCSDADCSGTPVWIHSMAAAGGDGINIVCGPVRFREESAWMQEFQQIESAGLIAIGACSLDVRMPTMCNGANLMFRKSAWEAVNGYTGHAQLASGDDELLMHALAARFPGSLVFQKSVDACVETAPQASRKAFLEQRKRWLSKGNAHPLHVKLMRYAIGAFYLLLLCTFLLAPWLGGWPVFGFACAIWLLKTSAEWFFYRSILPFFRLKAGWLQLLGWQPWQVLYPVYLALSPGSKRFSWKNRHYF
jgi:cellulose synthase/poly-beta-1,6-N-acetylglucosamine synthase-like glycosyltransferase